MFWNPDPPPTCHLGPWGGQSSFSAWQVLSDTWIRAFGNVQTCPILHPHPSSPSSRSSPNSIHIPIHPSHPHPPPSSLFSILLLLTLHHHPPSHAWVSPSLPQPCESHPGCAGSGHLQNQLRQDRQNDRHTALCPCHTARTGLTILPGVWG